MQHSKKKNTTKTSKLIKKIKKKKNYEDGFQMLFGLVLMHLNVKRMCTVYNQNLEYETIYL